MSTFKAFVAGFLSTRFKGGLDRVIEKEEVERTAIEAEAHGIKIDPKTFAQALARSGVTVVSRPS